MEYIGYDSYVTPNSIRHYDYDRHEKDKEISECDMDQEKMQKILTRMSEEKQTLTYKKLVVPMSMRSIYWKYFGFPATDDGDILTKVKIVCILCKTQIAYNRNTSNLRMHLQNKHANEFFELEASALPRRVNIDTKEKHTQKKLLKASGTVEGSPHIYTTTADGTVQIEGDVQFITDPNINLQNFEENEGTSNQNNVRVVLKGSSPELDNKNLAIIIPDNVSNLQEMVDSKAVSDAITEFIVLDLQLPDVVEGLGFQKLIATLRSPCEIPSKIKLEEELIPKIYDTFKEAVQNSLASLPGEVGLSIKEWKSGNGEVYLTIAVHYQPESSELMLETKVLSTIHCTSEIDASQWNVTLDNLFIEWGIKVENITAVVVATSQHQVLTALSNKGLTLVPCLVHSLQHCTSACFEQPEVATILSKCRSIIGLISRNNAAISALRNEEQLMQLEEDSFLKKDYPRVWTSTYAMLEQLLFRKEVISSILENVVSTDRNTVTFSEDEWKVVEDLVTILEPFMVTIMTLSEEKTPLISLLKPLLWQLNFSHLKVKESDSETTKAFKELLSENLSERYSDTSVNILLQIATALDPRFKLLPYASEDDKNIISSSIKEMLINVIEEEGERSGETVEEESPNKKSRLSGMEFLLGDLCASKSGIAAEERANLELVHYQSESIVSLDFCPLQWWARASIKCPNLARLAHKYNCVPASAVPSHQLPQEKQVLFDMRRACLEPELVDKMLFLNGNHNV